MSATATRLGQITVPFAGELYWEDPADALSTAVRMGKSAASEAGGHLTGNVSVDPDRRSNMVVFKLEMRES